MPKQTKTLAKRAPQPLAAPIEAPAIDPETLEKALVGGDIGALNPAQRMQYYSAVCQSLSLNPLTRPLEFTSIDGKTVLYARKDCTEQLRRRDGIKIVIAERKTDDGIHWVRAIASLPGGREDEAIGAVPMVEPAFVLDWHPTERGKKIRTDNPHKGKPLSADVRAKAMMLAETKAKRRVTLSIAGLGIPDESELESQFEPAPAPEVTAVAEEKKTEAKIIEKGGTVVKIEPDPAPQTESVVLPPEPAADKLLDVECHIGNAGGPWLGKKVRDIVPKALFALWNQWAANLEQKPSNKDARLRDAVKLRMDQLAAEESSANAPETPATPPEEQTTATDTEKASKPAKRAKATPASEPPPLDWKAVVVPLGGIKGKKLGELDAPSLLQCYVYALPLLTLQTQEEKDFDKGVRMWAAETKTLTASDANRQMLVTCAVRDLDSRNLTAIQERMKKAGVLDSGRLSQLDDAAVTAMLENWETIAEKIKAV